MCFRKVDLLIWIRFEEQKAMLRLRAEGDGREYNDFFTIERILPAGQGAEVLFTLPFREISDISYDTSYAKDLCMISFDMGAEARFAEIKVDRHCFNLFVVRKMIKIYRKSKKDELL